MDFDVVLLIIILIASGVYFRKFEPMVYLIVCLDLFFRIITFLKNNLGFNEIEEFLTEYVPESIPSIIDKYTAEILYTLIIWLYVSVFAVFLFYTAKLLWKKRRR